jgi:hypothetical protein
MEVLAMPRGSKTVEVVMGMPQSRLARPTNVDRGTPAAR